jgi:hypothetical protein
MEEEPGELNDLRAGGDPVGGLGEIPEDMSVGMRGSEDDICLNCRLTTPLGGCMGILPTPGASCGVIDITVAILSRQPPPRDASKLCLYSSRRCAALWWSQEDACDDGQPDVRDSSRRVVSRASGAKTPSDQVLSSRGLFASPEQLAANAKSISRPSWTVSDSRTRMTLKNFSPLSIVLKEV